VSHLSVSAQRTIKQNMKDATMKKKKKRRTFRLMVFYRVNHGMVRLELEGWR
jgi:hypothetical protein